MKHPADLLTACRFSSADTTDDCLITPHRHRRQSLPSSVAFPVYNNRKLLEQKGQVVTTRLLLLGFSLSLPTTLTPTEMLARASPKSMCLRTGGELIAPLCWCQAVLSCGHVEAGFAFPSAYPAWKGRSSFYLTYSQCGTSCHPCIHRIRIVLVGKDLLDHRVYQGWC